MREWGGAGSPGECYGKGADRRYRGQQEAWTLILDTAKLKKYR